MVPPSSQNVAAVVVLFKPEGNLIDRLQAILAQVRWLIIIANDGEGFERLGEIEKAKIFYVTKAANAGLGVALNEGLEIAARKKMEWALLLDQDTVVDRDLVAQISAGFSVISSGAVAGIMAPNYRSPRSRKLAHPRLPTWQQVPVTITSGSFVSLAAVARIGGMKEDFFIEGIDLEFSLRARKAGYSLWRSGVPLMTHGAGECVERRLGWRKVMVSHHAAWRYHLQFRNVVWILCHYASFDPNWTLQTVWALMKKGCLIVLFESQRPAKISAMARGVWDGLRDRLRQPTQPN